MSAVSVYKANPRGMPGAAAVICLVLVGIGVWVVSLPFTVFSGSTGDAGVKLIAEPGAHTFTRPLGYPAPVSPDN